MFYFKWFTFSLQNSKTVSVQIISANQTVTELIRDTTFYTEITFNFVTFSKNNHYLRFTIDGNVSRVEKYNGDNNIENL